MAIKPSRPLALPAHPFPCTHVLDFLRKCRCTHVRVCAIGQALLWPSFEPSCVPNFRLMLIRPTLSAVLSRPISQSIESSARLLAAQPPWLCYCLLFGAPPVVRRVTGAWVFRPIWSLIEHLLSAADCCHESAQINVRKSLINSPLRLKLCACIFRTHFCKQLLH